MQWLSKSNSTNHEADSSQHGTNRDDNFQLHPSGLRIPIAPILDRKISSPLVPAWRNFCRQEEKQESTRTQDIRANSTRDCRPSGKGIILHHSPESNCLVCSLPHAVTLRCCRFFGSRKLLANSGFCVSSCCFGVVHPDVCLKQNSSSPLVLWTCAAIETGLKRRNPFPLRWLRHSARYSGFI